MSETRDRAQGSLLGQLIGDSLGSLVEFQHPERIRASYPEGVRELADGGTWNTIAGQPTDDSEMALALARTLVRDHTYEQSSIRESYVRWLESGPFDVGSTTSTGLRGLPNFESQANGALMRISPLGIFCASVNPDLAARWAREDAWITHPHEVTQDASVVFVLTLAGSIRDGLTAEDTFRLAIETSRDHQLAQPVRDAIDLAQTAPPESFVIQQGWVLIALQNAFYQLLRAGSVEDALIDTVMMGGDTDTNAAIAGALVGAVRGRPSIPSRWVETVLNCRPLAGSPGVRQPRPEEYWPVDALDLAEQLLQCR